MTSKEDNWSAQQQSMLAHLAAHGGSAGIAPRYAIIARSGREILEAMMSGALPYPPMNDTMNMALMQIDSGSAVLQGIAQERHYNPLGTIHGGWITRSSTCQGSRTDARGARHRPPSSLRVDEIEPRP